ncbi:MAG: DUF1177 domain-containing protein [Variibacter sp.]|nr:DUF1177 domain-containing protein [Variibacter sp.]
MALRQVLDAYELLDSAHVDGPAVERVLRAAGLDEIVTRRVTAQERFTDTLQVRVRGSDPAAPALGVVGKLGGIGARPALVGIVSDADGAIAAVAVALKLAAMQRSGDRLPGDVIISTHICPAAPTRPHHPVPFMSSPVDREVLGRGEVHPDMAAVLSIDTSRGNRVVNHKGIAITPTVREGYVLPVSMDLIDLVETVTATRAVVMPLSTQDITPYANGVFHINSILQPAVYTKVPVVGVAITAETVVPGCATGATQLDDVEKSVRFAIEVAKAFGRGACKFCDDAEFAKLVSLYGSMSHLQTAGRSGA